MSARRLFGAFGAYIVVAGVLAAASSRGQVPDQANDLTAVWPTAGELLPVDARVYIETIGLLAQAHVVDRPDVTVTVAEEATGAIGIRLFALTLSGVAPGERVDLAVVTTSTTTTLPFTIAPPFEGALAAVPAYLTVRRATSQDDVVADAPEVHVVLASTQAVDDPNVALIVVERTRDGSAPEIVARRVPRGDAPVAFFEEGSGRVCARLGLVDGAGSDLVFGTPTCVDLPEDTGCAALPPGAPAALLLVLAARRVRRSTRPAAGV